MGSDRGPEPGWLRVDRSTASVLSTLDRLLAVKSVALVMTAPGVTAAEEMDQYITA